MIQVIAKKLAIVLLYRCLEEGAEDYLVKPVKLADVKRLKDRIFKGEGDKENAVHKKMINDNPSSVQPTQKLEEDPSSVLPPSSQLLSTHLSCDRSISALAFSSSESLAKRPWFN